MTKINSDVDIEDDTPTPLLTDREFQVLYGISYGRTNGLIGKELCLSEDTVKTHARRLYKKLGVVDRAHAVRVGIELGILDGYRPRSMRVHPDAVPGQPVPAGGLVAATQRGRYSDTHIAACAAAEACPCRAKEAQHRLASA